jgi:predicted CoA-substrate-specific enzyme activase
MITAGFDIGTRFIKLCIVENKIIRSFSIARVSRDFEKTSKKVFHETLKKAGIKKRHVKKIVATGYGSELIKKASYTLSEPYCSALGISAIDTEIRTVIDVGGLFINISILDQEGQLEDSVLNDRCAAGSGKFLEVVLSALHVPFESASEWAVKSENACSISNNCAVFAESEVISLVNSGISSHDVLAGVINSIVSRTAVMLEKVDIGGRTALVGGLSKVDIFREKIETLLGNKLSPIPVDNQIITAYGAAIAAQEKQDG